VPRLIASLVSDFMTQQAADMALARLSSCDRVDDFGGCRRRYVVWLVNAAD
jgi:hypothetical protein